MERLDSWKIFPPQLLKGWFLLLVTLMTLQISAGNVAGQSQASQSKFLGNIIGNEIPDGFDSYWDQVTPERAGKWGVVAPGPDTSLWRWTRLDRIYDFAIEKGYPFKFHNLVWNQQQPLWVNGLDSAQQVEWVEEWIALCGRRYPNAAYVDVVNEPIRTPYDTLYPAYYKAIGGAGKTGWDWVIWSFSKARKSFPHSKLLLNEYNILNGRKPVDSLIHLINLLKERKLIDGIGIQGHFLEKTDSVELRRRLDIVESLGLPIFISEYDVDEPNDSLQLAVYKEQFPVFWKDRHIEGITLWGYLEGKIWRHNAYLIRIDGTERPAFIWLRSYVATHRADGKL